MNFVVNKMTIVTTKVLSEELDRTIKTSVSMYLVTNPRFEPGSSPI